MVVEEIGDFCEVLKNMDENKNIKKYSIVAFSFIGLVLAGYFLSAKIQEAVLSKKSEEIKADFLGTWENVMEGNFDDSISAFEKTKERAKKEMPLDRKNEKLDLQYAIAQINSQDSSRIEQASQIFWNVALENKDSVARAVALGRLAEIYLLAEEGYLKSPAGAFDKEEKMGFYEKYGNLIARSDASRPSAPVGYQRVGLYAEELIRAKKEGDEKSDVLEKVIVDKFKRSDELFSVVPVSGPDRWDPDRLFISKVYKARAINNMYIAGIDLASAGISNRQEADKLFEEALSMRNEKWLSSHPERYEYLARIYYAAYLAGLDAENNEATRAKIKEVLLPVYQNRIGNSISIYNLLKNESAMVEGEHVVDEILRVGKVDPDFRNLLLSLGWDNARFEE
jgi:hypothetical protein